MPADHVKVKLGDQEYVLVPQKHTYLKRRLGELFDSLQGAELTSSGSLLDIVGDKLYEVCLVFIPGLMSREQWEDDATSPTYVEIEAAIVTGLRVNGLNRVGALGKIISPEMIRALLQRRIVEIVASSVMTNSSTSPSTSGEQTSTPSLTSVPTGPATSDSDGPSDDSTPRSPGSNYVEHEPAAT